MANQEINELQSTQQRKRLLIGVAVVVTVALLGLGIWLMRGDKEEYSLGSPCSSDCGVYSYDGWICLDPDRYCTRPCGDTHAACPMGFSCQPVAGAPKTVTRDQAKQDSTYCLKGP